MPSGTAASKNSKNTDDKTSSAGGVCGGILKLRLKFGTNNESKLDNISNANISHHEKSNSAHKENIIPRNSNSLKRNDSTHLVATPKQTGGSDKLSSRPFLAPSNRLKNLPTTKIVLSLKTNGQSHELKDTKVIQNFINKGSSNNNKAPEPKKRGRKKLLNSDGTLLHPSKSRKTKSSSNGSKRRTWDSDELRLDPTNPFASIAATISASMSANSGGIGVTKLPIQPSFRPHSILGVAPLPINSLNNLGINRLPIPGMGMIPISTDKRNEIETRQALAEIVGYLWNITTKPDTKSPFLSNQQAAEQILPYWLLFSHPTLDRLRASHSEAISEAAQQKNIAACDELERLYSRVDQTVKIDAEKKISTELLVLEQRLCLEEEKFLCAKLKAECAQKFMEMQQISRRLAIL